MKTARFAAVGALLLFLPLASLGQTLALFWDTNTTTGGAQGGAGSWVGTNNWLRVLGSNGPWQDGSTAVFSANSGQVTVNGNVTANGLIFNSSGYAIIGSSILTLGGATPTINVANAGESASINAQIAGTAGLTKTGDGMLSLTGNNTYTGATTINAGVLSVSGALPDTSAVVLANVASAVLGSAGFETIGSLAGGGSTGGNVSVAPTATFRVGTDNTSTTFAGDINVAGNFEKVGTGTLELTNNSNTFSRGIVVANGALSVPNAGALGGAASITLGDSFVGTSGTLRYTGSGGSGVNTNLNFTGGGVIDVNSGFLQIVGLFAGNGGLTKSGSGSLSLNGTGTYSGATNIVGGRLTLTGNPIPSTSTVTLADVAGTELVLSGQTIGALSGGGPTGGNVILNGVSTVGANNASTTFAGSIVGTSGLNKSGGGTLSLAGTNTYSGATQINGGTLRLAGGNAIPNSSAVAVASSGGATLDLDNSNETIGTLAGGGTVTLGSGTLTLLAANSTFSGTITGTGGLTKGGSGTLVLTGTNTFSGATTINAGTLQLSSAGALSDTTAVTLANVAATSLDVTVDATVGSLSGGGATGGGVTLGSRTLTIGGNNTSTTYDGNVSGTGGTIVKTGTGTLTFTFTHTFTGDLTIREGALSVATVHNSGTNGPLGAGNTLILGGNGTTGTLMFTASGADSSNRGLILTGNGGAIDVSNAAGALTLSGAATDSGGLTKLGAGTLLLSGNNTYTGPTSVSAGRLQLSGGNAIGDSSATFLADLLGAVLELLGSNETIGSLAGGGANGGNVLLGTGSLTAGGDNSSTTFAGAISGSGGVTKTGTGMMTFSGANSYIGPTTIDAGTLRVGGGSALADTSPVIVAAGALLDLNNSSEAIGSLAGSGNVTLGSGTLSVGANNSSTSFAGAISGTGGLTKVGTGTFTVSGPNNYTGATTISAGTLALQNGLGTPGGALDIGASGTLQARNIVNRPISGSGTIQASGALVIGDPSSNTSFDFAGSLNVLSNLVVLLDADAASLGSSTTLAAGGRLDAPNGATLAAGRNLSASASATVSANFANQGTVNGPASAGDFLTLTGDVRGVGNYTGNVLFSDGFSPGMSAAAVSLENFAFDATTTLSIELGGLNPGTEYDRLNFTGSGLLDGTLSVSLINGYQPQGRNFFTVINGGALSGAFDAMTLPSLDPGLSWLYSQSASAAQLMVVPEPTSTALFALSVGALVGVRRSRAS